MLRRCVLLIMPSVGAGSRHERRSLGRRDASGELPIDSPCLRRLGTLLGGGVSERPKERASKAREGQPSAGSNPAATAPLARGNAGPGWLLRSAFPLSECELVSVGSAVTGRPRTQPHTLAWPTLDGRGPG